MLLVEYTKDKFSCDVLDGIKRDDKYMILNAKVIAKGVVDHTSKVYKFSHFIPYSNPSTLLIHTNEASNIFHEISLRPSFSLMDIAKDWKNMLLVEYAKDKFACDVLDGIKGDDNYRILNVLIYYKRRIYLVQGSKIKYKILQEAHDSPLAGHPGIFKTYRKLRQTLFWKRLKEDVQKYVNEFKVFQQNKS